MKLTRARVLGLYVLVAYALAWAPALWMAAEGHAWDGPFGRAVAVWSSFAPLLAALFVQGPVMKQPVLKPLGLVLNPGVWWLVAWLLPAAILLVAVGIAWALFGVDPVLDVPTYVANKRSLVPPEHLAAFEEALRESPPSAPLWLVVMGLPAGLTINLVPALAEETAYRGLLFREMPGGYFARSSLIGLVWAGAMLPAVLGGHLFPEHRLAGAALWIAYCVSMSLVLVYLRVRSGSTVAVGIARGTTMALTMVAVDLTFGASDLVRPHYGIAGILAVWVALGAFALHDRFFADQRLLFAGSRARDGRG